MKYVQVISEQNSTKSTQPNALLKATPHRIPSIGKFFLDLKTDLMGLLCTSVGTTEDSQPLTTVTDLNQVSISGNPSSGISKPAKQSGE